MGATEIGFAIASLVISAAGTAVSYSAQQAQAKNAAAIAQYNYAQQMQQNRVQAAMAQQQAQYQAAAAQSQYQAGLNNAKALEDQARATEAAGREQTLRQRAENERLLARQRARYAKSGVAPGVGSPLEVMAETNGLMELGIQDMAYSTELESRGLRRRADLERFQAGFRLMDAGAAQYEAAASRVGLQLANNQAEIDRLSGQATAAGYRRAATATLLSGAGSLASQGYQLYNAGAFSTTGSNYAHDWRANARSS